MAVRVAMGLALAFGVGPDVPVVEPLAAQEAGEVALPPVLTLDEAVERALGFSPQMAQSRQQLLNASEGMRTSLGTFLPTISSSAGGSLRSSNTLDPNTGEIVSGSSDSYSAGLSARYDLFTGGRRFAERDQARADEDAALARLTDQEASVVFQTKNLFFAVLRQRELLEVAAARVGQAEESLSLTRRQAQVGSATSSDTLRARLELINARQGVLTAEGELRNARVTLGRQVGVAGPVDAETPDDLDPAPLPLTDGEILAMAESQAPSVRAAEAAAGAADAAVDAAETAWLPTLGLSTGYNWNNQTAAFTGGRTSWSLGLNLSYPIFNGFQRESSIDRAQASLDVARRQEADARLAARQEADAALQGLRTAEQAVVIAGQALEVAQEDLRVVRERYQVGVARIFDVVVSQVALDQARVDLVQARYDYVLARAELESVLGREL